jgi:hypothetical protein
MAIALPLLCLAAPSFWLMTSVPPLWRDVDAYIQVSSSPGPSTILLHGPLYCQLARVPLWIGQLTTGESMGFAGFMKHPRLTDAGVYLLLSIQHAGLWLAAFYLLSALSASLLVRVALAIFFASHPMFYGFAHCVGSETLSMILILLLVGVGLRMVAAYPAVETRWWLLAGFLLWCCILTRHINGLLIGLLPLTFVLLALGQWWRSSRTRLEKGTDAPRFEIAQQVRACGLSIATGVIALLLASGYTQLLCRKAHVRPRSEAGFTFLWRLNFLPTLPTAARHALVERIAQRTSLPDSRRLLRFLQDWVDHHAIWEPVQFLASARAGLDFASPKVPREHFDLVLNDVAAAFLSPPPSPLVAIARDDFAQSTSLTESDIARYLFSTTDYINIHRLQMPQAATLITFRNPADRVMKFESAAYFRLWDLVSFRGWSVVWLGAVALVWGVGRRATQPPSRIISYAVALCGAGVLLTLVNCFFAQILPRFALPMMEFMLLSLTILLGSLLSSFLTNRSAGSDALEHERDRRASSA